ncbi:MAG: T9SS type A sorting domain-containing protein [Bacteroidales bacterium]|nr:T9SS type A sorting domain-containing protein [Bacteroidales bacterium]
MKKYLLGVFLMLSVYVMAQFPQPDNFYFSYQYYHINEDGPCGGQWIYGPTYCSHFSWSPPDTTSTAASLDHYNIYFNNYTDTSLIASPTDTFYVTEGGFIGVMWITAVYSNPSGESAPSNIQINNDLPISIREMELEEMTEILYNPQDHAFYFKNINHIQSYSIYNLQGISMLFEKASNQLIKTSSLTLGLYIIEIITKDNQIIRRKIIL